MPTKQVYSHPAVDSDNRQSCLQLPSMRRQGVPSATNESQLSVKACFHSQIEAPLQQSPAVGKHHAHERYGGLQHSRNFLLSSDCGLQADVKKYCFR
jgi:hypothetical protein